MIRVYVKSIDEWKDDHCYLESLKLVSCQRRDKINAYAVKEDRIRSLGAFLLLQTAVEEWTGQKEKPLEFAFLKNNKPYLSDYSSLYINISHSGDYVACAIADCEIGIDLQKWNGYKEGIVKRFFNEKELNYIKNLSTLDEKKENLYKIWTRKESYIKYIGSGMACDIKKVDTENGNGIKYCNIAVIHNYSVCICYADLANNTEPEIYIR